VKKRRFPLPKGAGEGGEGTLGGRRNASLISEKGFLHVSFNGRGGGGEDLEREEGEGRGLGEKKNEKPPRKDAELFPRPLLNEKKGKGISRPWRR